MTNILTKAKALSKIKAIRSYWEEQEKLNGKETQEEIDSMITKLKNKKKLQAQRDALRKEMDSKKRKFTTDGLPIFTEDELKLHNPNAGKTPLCPFDCDCCF